MMTHANQPSWNTRFLLPVALLLWIAAGAFTSHSQAATFYWDPDADGSNSSTGGTGTWDTTSAQWDTDVDNSNSNNTTWTNGTDIASFGGTAGTVMLGEAITVGGLEFTTDGYTLTGTGGNTLTLSGPGTIDVSGSNRAAVTADIAGTVGLVKNGTGTLNLGPSNSFTGSTIINAGTVEVYKDESLGSGNGAVVLNGGTLSALGNNFYSTRNVTIGASGGTLDVTRNYSTFGTMRLTGLISGSGTLTKTGFGDLRLDGDSSGFTGAFILDQGIVRLSAYPDRGQVFNQPSLYASSYTIRSGGDLQLIYSGIGTSPYYSAINETAPIHMEGGRIQYHSNNSGAISPWTQTMGDLFLDRGASRFYINRTSSSSATVWSFGNLTRAAGATADFDWTTTTGTLGDPGNNPRIVFNSIPTPVNDGILGGWALVNQVDFANYSATNGVAIATYNATDFSAADTTKNVDFTQGAATTTIGNTVVNSLKFTATANNSIIEQTDGTTLTLDTGGLLTIGNFTKYIQPETSGNATLTANGGGVYLHNAQSSLYIYSTITDGDMATALVKTQAGNLLIYSGTDNTYTGGTYINGASNVYTGGTNNRTYFGTGPVYLTRGILNLGAMGATTSTAGYSVFEGGSIYLNSASKAWTTDGDRFTVDGTSSIGGQSQAAGGGGLNSLTYVAGPVTAGGQAQVAAGATILHGTNATVMGAGTNTMQGLPNDMQFYFGPGATTTDTTTLTIGVGTPWRGIGNDRNTRAWDLGTIIVNGSDFELRAMLVPNQNGEGQSAYTLRIGNGTTAGAPVITGAASTPLTAHITGAYVGLDDDTATYGSIAAGSAVTFAVEAGATLEVSQSTAMGIGDGLASIIVLDGGTLQQYGSTDAARLAAAETGINGNVTVQSRGRFIAQNTNGLTGAGQLTFEPRSIIQINNNTGWTGAQALAAIGVNDAIVKINVDNFGTAAAPLLTTYFDGTGIYEWSLNANAANPTSANTVILSLDGAPGSGRGLVINDAFDRSLDSTANGFIELKLGGAGGTIASSSGQLFNIYERVELHGQTLTIGYADVIDGDPGLGDVRMSNVTSDAAGGTINVINGAQLRINATNAIADTIAITLQAGGWLDVDNNDTILQVTGGGATSRILGDSTLTVTQTGNYDLNASIGDTANILQTGGGILTIDEDSDGGGNLAVSNGTIKIGTGVSIGNTFNLNPTSGGIIDLNGTTNSVRAITGDSTGIIELNNGVLVFDNAGTVTIDSGEAVINGPGIIRLVGEGQVRFNQDPTRMTNISQIDIFNGEFRVDGVSGTPGTFLINAPIINLGDGFATTGGTGSQVFPRLYLVNTETTQTAALNVNGGWITSDLGANDLTIWSTGIITFTGTADTNLFDVNDAGTGDQHAVTSVITGTGGFSKINTGTLRLEANNTISGNIYIQRNGVGGENIDSTLSRGGIRLTEADGALSAANSVVVSRDGSLYLNNAAVVNNNRLGDSTDLELRAKGRLRIIGNSAAAVSEDLGALIQTTGSGKVNYDLDDTTPQFTSLTFDSYNRAAGAITQFQVLDNLAGEFGSRTGSANRAELHITDMGASALLKGGGGANGTTNQTLIVGAFGGVNNISNHFMTFDSVSTTELRPLQWDGDANAEYFLSRTDTVNNGGIAHQFTRTSLGTLDQNVNINFNVDIDGNISQDPAGYGWYGAAPVAILEDVAMNSLRFGTNTTTNGTNSNEIGSALVLAPGAHLYLGDSLAANTGLSGNTDGSGMILFGRDVSLTAPGSNQYVAGGIIDFGSREAIIVNESGNSALFRTDFHGTGGVTKAGAQTVYFDNSNSYSGDTNIAEGILVIRDQNALGDSTLVRIEMDGRLYLELGTNVINSATTATPPNLFVGINSSSTTVLHSNSANNTWGGDVIIDNVDNAGNWVFSSYLGTGALYTLNINGDIYSNELLNPINTDTALNDARLLGTNGISSSGGVINLNGQVRDNSAGAIAAPVTAENENQLLRFYIRGSDQAVVNARQQWDAAGLIFVENGILRYEGDGNFWTAQAAANMNSTNSQSGLRIGGNSNNWNAAVILTKAGQVLNIGRIDIGGDFTNDYNQFGNDMLAGTNTSGTVTFGDGTETIRYNGSNAANNFVRDLTAYQAGGGTMELNFRLDDTDADSHTSFTKIGRGVVNFNGQNDVNGAAQNGDVEQLNMSGGLLRLTNYGNATGRRFDTGAMITFAGGGIEMDGLGAIQNETANYTGAAVGALSNFPAIQTLIAPGGTDVIVTAADFSITMNIGADTINLTRQSGGTIAFVENATGTGNAVITLEGIGQPADNTAIPWATYGDTYTYNAALASYTLNALDFAMTSNAAGNIDQFTAGTREENSLVSTWATTTNDLSENGAGFDGTAVGIAAVNTIHFDFDGAGAIDATSGLEVTSGGIMVSSLVATDTSLKSINNGTLNAGVDTDLIIHQYGGAAMTISSIIQDNAGSTPGIGNALVKTGPGELILTGVNTYTGSTFLNGGQLTISSNTNLGATPGAPDADNIYANGGILRVLSDVELDANRGLQLGGNGIEISVGPASTLTFNGLIASEPNVIANYVANPAVGRIDKTGLGTLLLTNINNIYNGLTEVRQGTLKYEPTFTGSTTPTAFGSNSAFLDGTIVRSGATLELAPKTPATNSSYNLILQEWFTFEGGSTLDINPVNSGADPHDINYYFRGILQFDSLGNPGTTDGFQTPGTLAGAIVIDAGNQGSNNLNDAGGYITGDGGITKIGPGGISFRENNPEWTGQLIVLQGQVLINSAGNPLGTGTLPIILGHNLFGEQAGEPDSGNTQVQLLFQDEGGYRDVSRITQDIIVRADDGAGSQTKRLGAQNLANVDVVNFDGSLTLRDDVELFYTDSARDSTLTTSSNINNSSRSIGTLTNTETYYINFNGSIIGAVGNDLTTNVSQGGTANVINGSITSPFDDFVERAIFGLNGDNSGWAGNLIMGNTTSDVDTQHIVSVGHALGLTASNNVTLRNNATLQTSGNNIVIGSLLDSGTGLLDNFIENASTTAGSITITQATDATVEVVLRDGVNFFQLQPGEVDAALSFVKRGDATLTLLKGNTFTGSTTLAGGILRLAHDSDSSMLSDTADLILNDGILDLASTATHTEIVGGTIINGTVAIERSNGSSTINLNTITRNAGSLRISADNIATTDNTNVNGILGGWATVGNSWATNSTNGADGAIVGLNFFTDVDRLGGVIPNDDTANVRIIESGASGPVTVAVSGGTTSIYTLLQGSTISTATVDIGAGNTLRIGSGGVLLPDGSSSLVFATTGTLTAGTADDTAGTLFFQSQSAGASVLTVGAVIADNGTGMVDVRTAGPNTTVFTGDNTYTGATLVGSGILAIGDGGTTGTLGSGDVNVEASGILAFNRSDPALAVTGALTGNGIVAQNGTGKTTLNGSTTVSRLNFVAVNGTLATGVDNAINTTGNLTFGDTNGATTTSTVDLTNGSASIGGLLVQTNSATANQLLIGTGKTLTVNGGVTIGADANASATVLTVTGGGNLVVNSSGANFQVGGATGATNENLATLDLSGLTNFTADLGAGLFRIGDNNTGTTANASSATLATNNTITAGSILVGDGSGAGVGPGTVHTLTLGSGANTLNADIINVGSAVNRTRSSGEILFDGADTTGAVTIRGSNGTSSALINMVNTTGSTTSNMTSTIDLTGHTADVLAGVLTMASRAANTGAATATLSFDQGTLSVESLVMAQRTSSGTGDSTATLNLGDSVAAGTPVVAIGVITMGQNTSSGAAIVTADINVTGGNVTIGSGSGTAINMANADTGRTVDSTIDLTGGTTTVTGNIIRTGGAGTENATITLSGATAVLNMSGNSIGTATEGITFVTESGTLSNLAELNGGGGLTKTTTGKLTMDGVNTYTGVTTVAVNGGTLQFARQTALYNNTPASWTDTNLVVNSGGTAAFNVGGAGEFTAADLDIIKVLGTGVGGFLGGSVIGIDTTNATGTFTYGTMIADTNAGANSVGLTKLGTGTLEITGANTYTGKTLVSGGILSIADDGNLGTAPGAVVADQLTLDGGTLQVTGTTAIAAIAANRGITIGAAGSTLETAAATTTTVNSVITGGGDFTKTGDGTVLLMGVNTNTGATNVNAGTLGGTGTVGGNLSVNNGGTVAPGVAAAGLLTIGGDLAVSAGGTLLMQLGGATLNDEAAIRGNESNLTSISGATIASWESANTLSLHDHIVSNDASAPFINGVLKIDPAFLNGYAPVFGDVFDLLDWTTLSNSITGTPTFDFTGVVLGGELMFNTQLFATNGIIVVVPEPSRALLLMLGLGGLLLRRRRR